MHLGGTGIAQGRHQLAAGGAAHDRVVDHHHPLTGQHIRQGVELDADARLPHRLGGLDEGATHIAVLDQAIAEGDAAPLGIADRRRDAGIGHTDHNVGRDGGLAGQYLADAHPVAVQGLAEEATVRASEVDHLEHAEPGRLLNPAAALGRGIPGSEMDDLAGLHVVVKAGTDDVQAAGLTAHHPLGLGHLAQVAEHQGPDAVAIAQGKQALGGADHQAEGTTAAAGGLTDRAIPAEAPVNRLLHGEGDQLGIGGGGELAGQMGELLAQFSGIHQIAVVGQGHRPQPGVKQHRLGVAHPAAAGGGIAVVADGQMAG